MVNNLWSELQRRNVIRAALGYIAVSWVILQAISILFPLFQLPDSLQRIIVISLIVLFPFWLVFAWIYEYTPEGFKKTGDVPNDESITGATGRNLNAIILAGMTLAIILLISDRMIDFSDNEADKTIDDTSIAVLPFKNMSVNQANQHFCDGMMEAILNHLSKIPDLRVISRTSVEQFRENPPPIPTIRDQLDVSFIVEGSVQRIENQALITVQLINAKKDNHIWSEAYDRDLSEIFVVQAEITRLIADELKAKLRPDIQERIEAIPTEDPIAYDYYLRGNEFLFEANSWLQSDEEWHELLKKASLSFKLALERDSSFADAIIGLARVEYKKNVETSILEKDYLKNVLILVDQALSINPFLSEGYVLRSQYYSLHNQISKAKNDIDNGLKLKPNDIELLFADFDYYRLFEFDYEKAISTLHKLDGLVSSKEELLQLCNSRSSLFSSIGDMNMLESNFHKCQLLNPDQPNYFDWVFNVTGRAEKNIAYINEHFPETQYKHVRLGGCYVYLRDYSSANEHFKIWEQLVKEESANNWLSINDWHRYGQALVGVGEIEKGKDLLLRQLEINKTKYSLERTGISGLGAIYDVAGIYSFIGEKDSCYHWLSKLEYAESWLREGWMTSFINYDPLFDNIRNEERFEKILARAYRQQGAAQQSVRELLSLYN